MDSLVAYLAALNVVFPNLAILGGVSPRDLSQALDDYGNNEAWGSHYILVVVCTMLPGETLHVRVAGRQVSIALPTSGFQHSPELVRCCARRSRCELKSDVEADGRGASEEDARHASDPAVSDWLV